MRYKQFTLLFNNFNNWLNISLNSKIFNSEEEAELYFIKYKTLDYTYISNSIKKIFERNLLLLDDYYDEAFYTEFNIIGHQDLINYKDDYFMLNKDKLGFLFLNFKETQTYGNTLIDTHLELNDEGNLIFKTLDDLLFRIFKEFINNNKQEKYELIDSMIQHILASQKNKIKKFDEVFISYIFTKFLEKINNSEATNLNQDYIWNFEYLEDYESNLYLELKNFYSLYTKIISGNYIMLNLLDNIGLEELITFYNILDNTKFNWIIPILNCTAN